MCPRHWARTLSLRRVHWRSWATFSTRRKTGARAQHKQSDESRKQRGRYAVQPRCRGLTRPFCAGQHIFARLSSGLTPSMTMGQLFFAFISVLARVGLSPLSITYAVFSTAAKRKGILVLLFSFAKKYSS